jgi:hypothetical protein
MPDIRITHPKVFNRIVDFLILGATFFVSCLLFSAASGNVLFIQILVYSTLLLVCVHLSKRAVVSYNSSIGEVSRQIIGNGAGILIGTSIMLVLEKLVSASGEIFVAVIFSSVMAFFILGTLSPMVHKMPIVDKKPAPF